MTDVRPNILFVFSDQQRWDTCGCYNNSLNITPNLDQMSKEGTKFKYAFTCQPVCGPARSALQTGKYPTEMNTHLNHKMLPASERTVAGYLNKNGYKTGYIGKWHLASCGEINGENDFTSKPVPPERRGGYKDYWLASDVLEFTSHAYDGHMFDIDMRKREFPKGEYRADVTTDWAMEAIEQLNNKGNPFFLFISYIEPHHQNDHNHYEGPESSKNKFKKFDKPGDLNDGEGDWKEEYPDYLGCVESLDQNLGRLRQKLEELGISDKTLVIYTSDHGSHFRTRNSEYKRSCHEGCIRVPMVINGPGFKGGRTIEELVSLIDLPPTILNAAGFAEKPEQMQGEPLQKLIVDETSDWKKEVFIQISESQCGRAIRTNRWKYSVKAPKEDEGKFTDGSMYSEELINELKQHPYPDVLIPFSDIYEEEFLYDLDNDPHEKNNLVKKTEYKELRKELAKVLVRRIVESGDPKPRILPAK